MSPGVLRPLGLAWRPALRPASSMPSKGKPRDLSRIRIGRDGEHHGGGNREVASHCHRTLICDPSSSSKSVTRRTMERSLARGRHPRASPGTYSPRQGMRRRQSLDFLPSCDAHDFDAAADDVGGRFSPLGPRGIGIARFGRRRRRGMAHWQRVDGWMMALSHILARWNLHFRAVGVFDQHAILIAPTVLDSADTLRHRRPCFPPSIAGRSWPRDWPSSPSDFKLRHYL